MNVSDALAIATTITLACSLLFNWIKYRKRALRFLRPWIESGSFGGPEAAYMSAQKFRVAVFFRNIFLMSLGIFLVELLTYPANMWAVLGVGIVISTVLTLIWLLLASTGKLSDYFDV
jgi:hypothetical protein